MRTMTVHTLVTALPDPEVLRARCRALALLDALLDPGVPTHTFFPEWRPGVDLALMDNGSGDQYAIAFDPAGVFLHGFDHECAATPWRVWPRAHWPGLLDGLPPSLAHYPEDPEFQFEEFLDATVCVWREKNAPTWSCGPVTFTADESDGADWLFTLLTDGTPDTYVAYAEDYFERPVTRTAVATVQSGTPLTRETVSALSPTADFATVALRARELGYAVDDRPTA
ncbi:hypothetical protein EK410_09700 [Streptomyces sp. CAI-17]|nr:hypothetical protein [Streptomyces sp. CAI-17]